MTTTFTASNEFPAPAGMIPAISPASASVAGVPRACGDDPDQGTSVTGGTMSSPRLRG